MRVAAYAFAFVATALLPMGMAHADDEPPPKSVTHEYSQYEKETIALAVRERKATVDDAAEGKLIEAVDLVTLDVIEKRDPAPQFANLIHARSRPYVITREVLLGVGEPYRKVLVDETARNLRKLPQISLVIVIAVKGSTPDKVRLLVITKDVWSLRLNSDFLYVDATLPRILGASTALPFTLLLLDGKLQYLLLQPSETNFLGTHQTVGTTFILQPLSTAIGLRYGAPWVLDTRTYTTMSAAAIFSRQHSGTEGSFGSFAIGRALFSTRTDWAWVAEGDWLNEISRVYRNGMIGRFDARVTPQKDNIRFEYRSTIVTADAGITRSFGWARKHDVTLGAEMRSTHFETNDLSGYDPAAADEFRRRVVPVSDRRVGPYAQYRAYTTNFLRVIDAELLALQEDFRLGHDLLLKLYPAFKAVGSTRDLLGIIAGAQYTVRLGDGFVRGFVRATVESESDHVSDSRVEGRVRVMSPRSPIGRVVFDGQVLHRYRNYLNAISYLGSDTRPRGYPSKSFFGPDVALYSLEYRSRPLEILSCQVGGVLFFDAGDAFNGIEELRLHHSVGFGVRALFPQLDRITFRGDAGFPIDRRGLPAGVRPYEVVISVGQAFSVPNMVQ